MDEIQRRAFMKGAAIGTLAFTVGGVQTMLTPRQAQAQNVALRTLTADQAATLAAMGETLVPGAKDAGVVNFVDQQLSIPPEEALLEARIMNVRRHLRISTAPPLGAIRRCEPGQIGGRGFAQLNPAEQHDFGRPDAPEQARQLEGPGAGFVYFLFRTDAVDVVYGTMDGYAHLGVPYQAHIAPTKSW